MLINHLLDMENVRYLKDSLIKKKKGVRNKCSKRSS